MARGSTTTVEEPKLTCPSCGTARLDMFCPSCGEKVVRQSEFGAVHFLGQAFSGLTTFDNKLIRSIRCLIFRPGELTRDWMRGARVRHLRPVQLFLLVNVLVVLLDRWTDLSGFGYESNASLFRRWVIAMKAQAAELGLEYGEYERLYAAKSSSLARSTVGVIVLTTALISLLLNTLKERRMGVHLVFGAHAVTFFLLVPDLLMLSSNFWGLGSHLEGDWRLFAAFSPFMVFGIWWYLATRRAFGVGRIIAVLQALLAPILFFLCSMMVHQYVVFRLTLQALDRGR